MYLSPIGSTKLERGHPACESPVFLRDLSVNLFFLGVEPLLAYFQRRVKKRKTLRSRRDAKSTAEACSRFRPGKPDIHHARKIIFTLGNFGVIFLFGLSAVVDKYGTIVTTRNSERRQL